MSKLTRLSDLDFTTYSPKHLQAFYYETKLLNAEEHDLVPLSSTKVLFFDSLHMYVFSMVQTAL